MTNPKWPFLRQLRLVIERREVPWRFYDLRTHISPESTFGETRAAFWDDFIRLTFDKEL